MANNDPSLNPDPDLAPENSPGASNATRTGTRRINKTPMVIVFALMVLFLIVVIGVMYSRSQRQITQNTEAHTSAAKQADSIIPKQLAWASPPVEPTPTPRPLSAVPTVLASAALSSRRPIRWTPPGCRHCKLLSLLNPPSKELLCPRRAVPRQGENDPEARKLALLQGLLARNKEGTGSRSGYRSAEGRPHGPEPIRCRGRAPLADQRADRKPHEVHAPHGQRHSRSSYFRRQLGVARHDHRRQVLHALAGQGRIAEQRATATVRWRRIQPTDVIR